MSFETAYLALNALVAPAWALLILLPRAGVTRAVVHSGPYPLVYGAIYCVSLGAALFFGQSDPQAGMGSLAGVMALFSHPNGVITGWTHFLAFDLFVGAWIGRDAQRRGVPHLAVIPCLLFAFVFGPVGLLLYLLLRMALKKGGLDLFETQIPSASNAS
ncbi:MAG: ABA4-like family protein [Hyphomonadaceae bacterium]